ncbi:unnamed protein product [Nyctereutes procyonoides]|uniref:(raccoon dog) hypothetical protein n=1 Tax=Nyctereutes procyonoides TaxID=34880 RepID=A0A811ZQK1_NYCPR|nr:unnamed protein product [Nyctereutes procyonoides]
MATLEGPVTFKDVIVEFTREEWQLLNAAQRTLYREVMQENYGHLISVGYHVNKPNAVFKLKQGKQPWILEVEFPHWNSPGRGECPQDRRAPSRRSRSCTNLPGRKGAHRELGQDPGGRGCPRAPGDTNRHLRPGRVRRAP